MKKLLLTISIIASLCASDYDKWWNDFTSFHKSKGTCANNQQQYENTALYLKDLSQKDILAAAWLLTGGKEGLIKVTLSSAGSLRLKEARENVVVVSIKMGENLFERYQANIYPELNKRIETEILNNRIKVIEIWSKIESEYKSMNAIQDLGKDGLKDLGKNLICIDEQEQFGTFDRLQKAVGTECQELESLATQNVSNAIRNSAKEISKSLKEFYKNADSNLRIITRNALEYDFNEQSLSKRNINLEKLNGSYSIQGIKYTNFCTQAQLIQWYKRTEHLLLEQETKEEKEYSKKENQRTAEMAALFLAASKYFFLT